MSKWIKLVGEVGHECQLPWSISDETVNGIHLQKRHAGSIWQCHCGLKYEWNGKKFNGAM